MGMARAMARRGHEVSIYTTNFNGADDLDVPLGVPVDSGGVMVTYFPVHAPLSPSMPRASGKPACRWGGRYGRMRVNST